MAHDLDNVLSLSRSYALPSGLRVRLRLAQSRDRDAIRELLRAAGRGHGDLDLARLVHFDPRRRVVLCAAALIDRTETIVGVGAIDVDSARPHLLCVEASLLGGLPELLSRALRSRVSAITDRTAA
jgi:hypothetical protein